MFSSILRFFGVNTIGVPYVEEPLLLEYKGDYKHMDFPLSREDADGLSPDIVDYCEMDLSYIPEMLGLLVLHNCKKCYGCCGSQMGLVQCMYPTLDCPSRRLYEMRIESAFP